MATSKLPQPNPNSSAKHHSFLPNLFSLWRKSKKTNQNLPPWMRLYRRFTLEELTTATHNFDLKIEEEGFYSVYKGFTSYSYNNTVTVKRFKSDPQLQEEFFLREMELLSNLNHHPNIVSLIGYCFDGSESDKCIVYEYMPHGTLHDQIHSRNDSLQPILSWKKRLEICIGAARGLELMHTSNPSIIHRDIKTRNILLSQNWVAKISNFDLSKTVPTSLSESNSHVTTRIVGTMGYIDPEYMWTGHLTVKSDVYSFGVILFEVLSARAAMGIVEERMGLIQWCRQCVEDVRLDEIIDPRMKDEIAPDCLKAYADMAYKCSNLRGNERPTIDAVVKRLQLILLLQECIEADIPFSPSWLRSIVPPPRRTEPLIEMIQEEFQGSEISSEISVSDYDPDELLRD
ncbi:hypothetical protein REPUB_Repub15cG0132300 [Reevesia pubescens]